MKKSMIFIVLTVALTSCLRYQEYCSQLEDKKICNLMMDKLAKEASLEDRLRCKGYSGRRRDGVNYLTINFSSLSHTTMTVDTTRILLVKWMERYKHAIHQYTKLRPFLKIFPVTAENIGIGVDFYDKTIKLFSPESVTDAFAEEGEVYYSIPVDAAGSSQLVRTETYEEARRIVGEKYPELLLEFEEPSVPMPTEKVE